jgi:multidrug resistance efflux pump
VNQARNKLEIEKWLKPLEQLKSEGIIDSETSEEQRLEMLDTTQPQLDDPTLARLEHDWNHEWSGYQSKLRLLKLDVEEARLTIDSATTDLERMRQLAARQAASAHEVQKAAATVSAAKINLKRAEELLKLYFDIEMQEPERNPDYPNAEK